MGPSPTAPPPPAVAQPSAAQPSLPPPASGVPACDSYVLEYRAFLDRCASQLGAELAALRQNVEAQVATYAAWDRLDDATRAATVAAAAPGCVAATASLHARAAALKCSEDVVGMPLLTPAGSNR
jgi:hypothetical protein